MAIRASQPITIKFASGQKHAMAGPPLSGPRERAEFFEIFDNSKLAFLHPEETDDGAQSRFNKFVSRD